MPCAWPLGLLARPKALHVTFHGADVRLLLALPAPLREQIVGQLLGAERLRFVATSLLDALAAVLSSRTAGQLYQRAEIEPPWVLVDERVSPETLPFPRYAVAVGRLVASKRMELALRAVAQAEGWGLVVVGDGPERDALEQLGRQLLPGRHRFTGLLGRPEALGYLAGASVLLHPSAEEAAPTVVLEALALGVPVLACGAGDTERWAREGRNIQVLDATPAALARALEGLRGSLSRLEPRGSSP